MLKEPVVSKFTLSSETTPVPPATYFLRVAIDANTANAMQAKNTTPTLSIKGKEGKAILNNIDNAAEPTAAVIAPAEFIVFQNMPSKKITTIPGVKKPVNSCIY